jgi:type II secretory pathway predicted ATPase ExeA
MASLTARELVTMIEQHFGFQAIPFQKDVHADGLYLSSQLQELQARLDFLIRTRGIGLITGEVGSGKSTAVRRFCSGLDPSRYLVLYVSDSTLTPRMVYSRLLLMLGINSSARNCRSRFENAVLDTYDGQGKLTVLVIDEAHCLPDATIHEIRFIANFKMDSASPMAIVIIGQPELRQRLKLAVFEPIAQRITVRFHMTGMTATETKEYIKHCLESVGCNQQLFSDTAVARIHDYSRGLPRLVNNMCRDCLVAACIDNTHVIDEHIVERVRVEHSK